MSRSEDIARIVADACNALLAKTNSPIRVCAGDDVPFAAAKAIEAVSAPSALPVRGWRDIATAPPYRVPVLLIAPYPTKTGWTDIYYGWRNAGGSNWERWPHDCQPTHWMPLPSPPSEPGVK